MRHRLFGFGQAARDHLAHVAVGDFGVVGGTRLAAARLGRPAAVCRLRGAARTTKRGLDVGFDDRGRWGRSRDSVRGRGRPGPPCAAPAGWRRRGRRRWLRCGGGRCWAGCGGGALGVRARSGRLWFLPRRWCRALRRDIPRRWLLAVLEQTAIRC